jgi:branched-chain amino acid transport system ATP-binding protein
LYGEVLAYGHLGMFERTGAGSYLNGCRQQAADTYFKFRIFTPSTAKAVMHGVSFDINLVKLWRCWGCSSSRSTKAIMGLVDCHAHHLEWWSAGWQEAFQVAHIGIGYVPENRDVFPNSPCVKTWCWAESQAFSQQDLALDSDVICGMFPRLQGRQRKRGVLSGGEMLTLCRTLMGDGPDHH